MRHRMYGILVFVVLLIGVLIFLGYNVYRRPAMFRNLSDQSLSEEQVEELRNEIHSKPDKKVLVTYFSYSGTTRTIAEALSERAGADLFEIAPQAEYSNVYLQSNSEIRKNERPELNDMVSDIDSYDIVFVGFPVWWHATPAPINTFLESYALDGKLIIPFCTSGGSDIEEAMPTFLNSCEGLAIYGERRISSANQIDTWLSELNLNFE